MNTKNPEWVTASATDITASDIDFRGEAFIQAAAASEDGSKGPPTFNMVAYTGGAMRLRGWNYPVVVDLQGMSGLDKARPILKDHDQRKAVGHANKGQIVVSDGQLLASGVISGHGDHVDEVVQAGLKGFPWQASIGAKVLKNEFIPKGETAQANGQTFGGPVNIARRTSLGEVSFVALGADDDTTARIAANAAKGSVMTFEQWLKDKGIAADGLSDALQNVLKASFDAEQKAIAAAAKSADDSVDEDPEADDEDDEDEPPTKAKKAPAKASVTMDVQAIAAEAADAAIKATRAANAKDLRRIAKVREIAASHPEIAAQAVEEGWDETKTELTVLRKDRQPASGPNAVNASFGINTGAGEAATPEIVAAACALAGGVGEKFALAGLNEQQKNIVASRKVRNTVGSVYGLCSIVAAANGVRMPSSRMDEDVLRAMQTIERRLEVQADGGTGGFSTMSLSGITENILNKALLEAYGNVDSVVPDLCWETDTNDFKQFKRYRLTASGLLQALGAAGELKSITLQDESYANQVKTQGVILTIGRDKLIDDDMGALTQAPTLLGRGAALYREQQVFTTYAALPTTVAPGASTGQTANAFNFFSTGAKNYLSGGTSPLSITSLTSAVQKFREQKDANNQPIMLKPDRLLVPPALEATADNLFNGANLIVGALGSTSAKSTEPNLNQHKGKYRPIVSPYLGAASPVTGQTDTSWALLCAPAGGFATLQIGYLRGQRVPIIERAEANFNTLGIAMRCYYDFGVAPHDYRCGVYSAGA